MILVFRGVDFFFFFFFFFNLRGGGSVGVFLAYLG